VDRGKAVKKNAGKVMEQECWTEDMEPPDEKQADRVILKKEPLPRKTMLLEAGVKEVRCIWCIRIKPLATAEELGDGWICEDCLSEMEDTRQYGGQRGLR
jgi:hypothetical protein